MYCSLSQEKEILWSRYKIRQTLHAVLSDGIMSWMIIMKKCKLEKCAIEYWRHWLWLWLFDRFIFIIWKPVAACSDVDMISVPSQTLHEKVRSMALSIQNRKLFIFSCVFSFIQSIMLNVDDSSRCCSVFYQNTSIMPQNISEFHIMFTRIFLMHLSHEFSDDYSVRIAK